MIEKIGLVVDYIDENYHNIIEKDRIEELTNVSLGHFRNKFKEIVGMPLDKYRIRRELTLIIDEIERNAAKISKSNLLPWNDENGFYNAFKKEFNIAPKQYLIKDNRNIVLQEKFDIETYNYDKKLINELKKEHGNYENALVYLLSLPVYKIDGVNMLFSYKNDEEFYKVLIRDYYTTINGEQYLFGEIPKQYYKNNIKQLQKYYDKESCIQFDTFEDEILLSENMNESGFFQGNVRRAFINPIYIVVKRNLISQLFELVDINIFFKLFDCGNLKTIWHAMIEGQSNIIGNETAIMPNELIEQRCLTFAQWAIVHEIVFIESGLVVCNNINDLRERIQYDYNKPIEKEGQCDNCKLKEYDYEIEDCKYAYDDSCPRDAILTQEEKEIFERGPEWEILKIDTLKQELVNLMIMGLVYL